MKKYINYFRNFIIKTLHFSAFLICIVSQNYAQDIPSYVPVEGLVGWWPLDGSGMDLSINQNNAEQSNVSTSIDRFGQANKCMKFNGISSRMTIKDNSSLDISSVTISGWFNNSKGSQNVTDLAQALVAKWNYEINCFGAGDAYTTLLVNKNGNNQLLGAVMNYNIVNGAILGNTTINMDQWHHFLFIHDEEEGGSLYLDCVLIGKNSIKGPICATTNNLLFGADSRFGVFWRHFNGSLDDIGIWNRPLSDCEITALCESKDVELVLNVPSVLCLGSDVDLSFNTTNKIDFNTIKWFVDGELLSEKNPILTISNINEPISEVCVEVEINCVNQKKCESITNIGVLTSIDTTVTICNGESFLDFKSSGNYEVVLESNSGCDSILSIDLRVLDSDSTTISDITICSDSLYFVNGEAVIADGLYHHKLKNIVGCDSIITVIINILDDFTILDTTLCSSDKLVFSLPYRDVLLNNVTLRDSIITITESGEYTIMGIDIYGCSISNTFNVLFLNKVYFPNVFSPNSDGKNDIFYPHNIDLSSMGMYSLRVFDRWGNNVFNSSASQTLTWDGTFNNKACDTGIYTYKLNIHHADCFDEIITGTVLLMR